MADRISKLLSEHLVHFDCKPISESVQGLNLRNSSASRTVFEHSSTWFEEEEISSVITEWLLHFLDQREFPERLSVKVIHLVLKKIFDDTSLLKETKFLFKEGHEKYSAEKLENVVLKKMKVVGEEWMKAIEKGDKDADLKFLLSPPLLTVSFHAIKNTRRKMEDRHVCMQSFHTLYHLQTDYKFFAVFDGHGGVEAAKYAAIHLPSHLATSLQTPSHQPTLDNPSIGSSVDGDRADGLVPRALKEAFRKTDERFCQRCKLQSNNSGSTGVCLLVGRGEMHVAWVGDSQAVLVRDGKAVQVMNAHKPEREDERERITALGGSVDYVGAWRVNGTLSVSRAIGDFCFKPWISSEADCNSLRLHPLDQYVVLACDGLWDVISFEDVVKYVDGHVVVGGNGRSSVAAHLVKVAKEKGSQDNISVVVVFLDGMEGVEGSYGGVEEERVTTEGKDYAGKGNKPDKNIKDVNNSSSADDDRNNKTNLSTNSASNYKTENEKDGGGDDNDCDDVTDSRQSSSTGDSKRNYLCGSDASSGEVARVGRTRGGRRSMKGSSSEEDKENLSNNSLNFLTLSGQSSGKNFKSPMVSDDNEAAAAGGGCINPIDEIRPSLQTGPVASHNTFHKAMRQLSALPKSLVKQTSSVTSSLHHQQQQHPQQQAPLFLSHPLNQQPQQAQPHCIMKASISTKSLCHEMACKQQVRMFEGGKEKWTVAVETAEDLDAIFKDGDNMVRANW